MTRPAVLVLLALLAGCGGERGEIIDTVQSFWDAALDGDGEEACALLTRRAAGRVVRRPRDAPRARPATG